VASKVQNTNLFLSILMISDASSLSPCRLVVPRYRKAVALSFRLHKYLHLAFTTDFGCTPSELCKVSHTNRRFSVCNDWVIKFTLLRGSNTHNIYILTFQSAEFDKLVLKEAEGRPYRICLWKTKYHYKID